MHKTFFLAALAALSAGLVASCSAGTTAIDSAQPGGEGGGGGEGGAGGAAGSGDSCASCQGSSFVPCGADGVPGDPTDCAATNQLCVAPLGCVACQPNLATCVGNERHSCAADGSIGALIDACDPAKGETCVAGVCSSGCQLADGSPSNVGCEFWAVDLDNEPATGLSPNAAAAPWALAISNNGETPASVIIEINQAAPGEPLKLAPVKQFMLAPGQLWGEQMPTREVDGSATPGDDKAPGTWLSSNAFRITSTAPVVVYQFNTATNSFSNDASLLLPRNALGSSYRVLGWPAANPLELPGVPHIKGLPDRTYVTIVGVEPNTTVKVRPTWRVKAGGPIGLTGPGGEISMKIGPFDVLNLETDDAMSSELLSGKPLADLTGTAVEADAPIAVFSGSERAAAPGNNVPKPPGWMDSGDNKSSLCCTDHLEEQIFPLTSIGKKFIITRSPVRSKGSWHEPDVLRFLGAAETTEVTTTLPSPNDHFTLQPGELRETYTDKDIVVTATQPVIIGQILVSQTFCNGALTGDPSLTIYPPTEQYRKDYLFLVPPSWDTNHVVISAQVGSMVTIDGQPPGDCEINQAGMLDGVMYESRRCPLVKGVHKLAGDQPFGIIAYGYGNAGSYAFAGGADVKKIYEPPPIK
jgi:hypothetical protein